VNQHLTVDRNVAETGHAAVSLREIHAYDPSVAARLFEGHRLGESARLYAANGTEQSYALTALADDRDGYMIEGEASGEILCCALVCRRRISW
jgi:hypothetical protein